MSNQMASDVPLILIGAGGHASVLQELAQEVGRRFLGVCDPHLSSERVRTWRGLSVLGGDDALNHVNPIGVSLVNGVGQLVGSEARRDLFERLSSAGFTFSTLIHPAAWVSPSAKLAEGVQVMAGAIIQAGCSVDRNTIINTRASVDHDCTIGQHVHIAPGATLCGGVEVEDEAFIGAGAVVIQGLRVGSRAIVGAGATLSHHLDAGYLIRTAKCRLSGHKN